ncbi:outer membrane beta-barrel protein [Sphingomonas sp. LaA6.9]|uniref:outer membrane beta-barrel protein n=1 Tax=Sphingomonas sp. LaA6.9 TaxID=2919914 RepID=UPI001F4F5020|nr:outer membrane beta-barrel protein [Sphingomonas sp. LaA6.9]MCJ8157748.1 porin family protein [Sphingomonas sp. LaA6.9]
MIMLTVKRVMVAAVLGGVFGATSANAQALDDKFWIEGSAYFPKVDTDIRVSSLTDNTVGTEIDLESDLGLDNDSTLPAVFAGVRLGSNFSIGAEYYSLGRDGTVNLARDIVFDDVTYPATASITSKFNTDVYRLTLGYAFVREDNFEIGAALGLHATDFEIQIEGIGNVGGATGQFESRRRSALAPLPTVGLFGAYEIMPKLTLTGRIDYLSLSIDDYDGRLINTQAALTYRVFKNVGIGAMYRYVDYRLDVEKPEWEGRIAYEFKGPAIFLQVGF